MCNWLLFFLETKNLKIAKTEVERRKRLEIVNSRIHQPIGIILQDLFECVEFSVDDCKLSLLANTWTRKLEELPVVHVCYCSLEKPGSEIGISLNFPQRYFYFRAQILKYRLSTLGFYFLVLWPGHFITCKLGHWDWLRAKNTLPICLRFFRPVSLVFRLRDGIVHILPLVGLGLT